MENEEDSIKQRVEELNNIIKDASKELDDIQSNCNHKETDIKSVGELGRDIRKICLKCNRIVGYPSQSEIENYMNK